MTSKTKAYVLVETAVGQTREVATAMRGVDGVESVDVVTGPYDIIAVLGGGDVHMVGALVTEKVSSLHGVVRTITNFAIPNGR